MSTGLTGALLFPTLTGPSIDYSVQLCIVSEVHCTLNVLYSFILQLHTNVKGIHTLL